MQKYNHQCTEPITLTKRSSGKSELILYILELGGQRKQFSALFVTVCLNHTDNCNRIFTDLRKFDSLQRNIKLGRKKIK